MDSIGLIVADLAASLAFYRRVGLEIPADAEKEPHVEVSLPGGLRLLFDTAESVRSFDPGWQPASGGHRAALGFACTDPSHVDSVHAELVAAGYPSHLDPFDAFWGQRYATVLDPDGNAVEFFAPLA